MKFIDRLFAKRKPRTPLEEFGAGLTPHSILAAMRTHASRNDRIAIGIATAVLVTANRFAAGFQKFLSGMPALDGKENHQLPYDALIIEAAAYCHYTLSRDYPPGDDNYEDETSDDSSPAPLHERDINGSDACAKALFYSQAIISRYIPEGYPENFLEKRLLFYLGQVLPRDERRVIEFFSSVLLSVINEKSPQSSSLNRRRPGLVLSLATGTYVPIFHQGNLAGLRKSVRNLLEKADELLRECAP